MEAVFEGEEDAVKAVVEFCKVGPKDAAVSCVDVNWEPYREEFQSFAIAY